MSSVITETYDELFGRETRSTKECGKHRVKQATKREKKVIQGLKASRDEHYVQLIVAYGLAFKAKVAVKQARWASGEQYVRKPKRKKNLDVRCLKRAGRSVHRRAKKILAKEGIQLRTRHSYFEGERLLSLHCD
jgi:hypothetical protein